MSNVNKVELNINGLRDIMKSPEMASIIEEHARRIARASGGSVGRLHRGSYAAMDSVFSEKDDNSLLRALR